MVKRIFDILVSLVALLLLAPVLLIAVVGIRVSSRGPIIYRARRIGRHGVPFTMHKFRTMHVGQGPRPSAITAAGDTRVFWFGSLLRALKVDEFPQFFDVLRGKMSLVGPRPEDPRIVRDHYGPEGIATLEVLPGLTSPGSMYYYTLGEHILQEGDAEQVYVEKLLPVKLALDLIYVREANFFYDLQIIFRTAWVILLMAFGQRYFVTPAELERIDRTIRVYGQHHFSNS